MFQGGGLELFGLLRNRKQKRAQGSQLNNKQLNVFLGLGGYWALICGKIVTDLTGNTTDYEQLCLNEL